MKDCGIFSCEIRGRIAGWVRILIVSRGWASSFSSTAATCRSLNSRPSMPSSSWPSMIVWRASDTGTFAPSLIFKISLPAPTVSICGGTGIALTQDGHQNFVTAFSSPLVVVNAAKVSNTSPDAIVGGLNSNNAAGSSTIEVIVTKDDQYAFASQKVVFLSDQRTATSEQGAGRERAGSGQAAGNTTQRHPRCCQASPLSATQ